MYAVILDDLHHGSPILLSVVVFVACHARASVNHLALQQDTAFKSLSIQPIPTTLQGYQKSGMRAKECTRAIITGV